MSESDTDELDAIRERKRRQLVDGAAEGDGRRAGPGGTEGSDGTAGTAEAPDDPVHVESAAHFDELVASHDVVLVDYYADWCGPCQMLAPIVDQVARATPAAVAKVDIDRHRDLAGRAQVRGVPTLHLYADGEVVEQLVGVQDQGTLMGLIERYAS